MLETFALAPASWFIAFVCGWALGKKTFGRYVDFNRFAWLGIGAYVASYLLSNLWRLGNDIETAVVLWQSGLFAIALMYGFMALKGPGAKGHSMRARATIFFSLISIPVFVTSATLVSDAVAFKKAFELGLLICISALCLCCFVSLHRTELLARLIWAVLVIAEGFAALEYLDCQLLHDPHRPRSQQAACSEIYGEFAAVAAPLVTTLALCYIIWMWIRARRRHGQS
ncbi:MAG: hypothetical protein ACR2RE_03350 [Geminicoccaceae bacterium]